MNWRVTSFTTNRILTCSAFDIFCLWYRAAHTLYHTGDRHVDPTTQNDRNKHLWTFSLKRVVEACSELISVALPWWLFSFSSSWCLTLRGGGNRQVLSEGSAVAAAAAISVSITSSAVSKTDRFTLPVFCYLKCFRWWIPPGAIMQVLSITVPLQKAM